MRRFVFLVLSTIVSINLIAQNELEFKFEITFHTNLICKEHGEFLGPDYPFILVKYESSCMFNKAEYYFSAGDTLLQRYFNELEEIFINEDFYRQLSKGCTPEVTPEGFVLEHVDGVDVSALFKSDSIERSISLFHDVCNQNPLFDRLLDNFFNISLFLTKQPKIKNNISERQISVLEDCESFSGTSPLRLVSVNPCVYRLKRVFFDNDYISILKFLSSMPNDNQTYLEVGSAFTVNSANTHYIQLKERLLNSAQLSWIANNRNTIRELRNLGIKKKDIFRSAPDCTEVRRKH